MTQSEPAPDALAEFILQQSAEGVAVPVMLFGPDRAVAADPVVAEPSLVAPSLIELARELDLDLSELELHSAEAYLLQCGYGQQVLDTVLDHGSDGAR